jgi:hypothetical protein
MQKENLLLKPDIQRAGLSFHSLDKEGMMRKLNVVQKKK